MASENEQPIDMDEALRQYALELDRADQERERAIEALKDLLAHGGWGHTHWDPTMQHGAGCNTCLAQNEARARAREFLKSIGRGL